MLAGGPQPADLQRGRRFLSATVGTIATKFILIFLRLAIGVLTARLLGPMGRGLFFATVQTSGTAATAMGLSVGEGLIYKIGKREIAIEQIFASVVFLVAICSALALTVLEILLPVLLTHFLSELPKSYVPLLFLLPPAMMTEYISFSALKGLKRFKLVNILTITTRSNTLVCIVIAVLFWPPTLGVMLTAFTIGSLLNALVFLGVVFHVSRWRIHLPLGKMLPTVKFGGSAHIGTLLTEVEYRLDAFILLYFLNAAAVGIYSIGVTMAQILWYVSNSINTVLFPYLVEAQEEDRDQFTAQVLKHSFYVNLILLVGLVICGMPLLTLLYGSLFSDAYFIFLILAPGLLCDTLSRSLAAWLKGCGRPLTLSWISAGSLALNIALNVVLIPHLGLYGAALASAISYSVRSFVLLLVFTRTTYIPVNRILLYNESEIKRLRKHLIKPLRRTIGLLLKKI